MAEDYTGVLIKARTISEAWEKAVLECWSRGLEVPTEYGEKTKELLGLLVHVEKPFEEPPDFNLVLLCGLPMRVEELIPR